METSRLRLMPCRAEHVSKLLEGERAFEHAFGLRVVPGYLEFPEVLPHMLETLEQGRVVPEWGSYLFIHTGDGAVIGLGGYKGDPDSEGRVEIGYGIADSYGGQGYATEAARGLLDHALASAEVRVVCAHTLPLHNASTRVLEKCGFRFVGPVVDPVDGLVWRWEYRKSPG